MRLKQRLSSALLRLAGWQLDGQAPTASKCVLIAAPHTSNWDFPWMILSAWALGMDITWLGKHTLFRWPYGWAMRLLGGIAVERDANQNTVEFAVTLLQRSQPLILTIPAEGTRALREYWRSGFYHIARNAGVPIVLSYLDYGRKQAGVGIELTPTVDVVADMDKIRAFYANRSGKFPELSTPIRLREETVDLTSAG